MAKTQTKKTVKKLTAKQIEKTKSKLVALKVRNSELFTLREKLRGNKERFLQQINGELAIVMNDLQNNMNQVAALETKLDGK